MAIKTILTEPNQLLRQVSKKVDNVGDDERKLMDDMLETMYDAPGIGLAAVQIGILKRVVVIDISKADEKKKPIFLINPSIKLAWRALNFQKTTFSRCSVLYAHLESNRGQ